MTEKLYVGDDNLPDDPCTCTIQRPTVGEEHDKRCLLYRQRGSGVSVLPNPYTAAQPGNWVAASGRTSLQGPPPKEETWRG